MPTSPTSLSGDALWYLLQMCDQFFPTGAYAFSHALETYVDQGLVQDRASCQELLESINHHALGPCDMVFCAHAFRLAAELEITQIVALDGLLSALKVPRELRLESRYTGQAFLRAAQSLPHSALVDAFFQQVQQGRTPGHHAIAFGLVTHGLGLSEEQALTAYLYNVNAGLVAAAVRLIPLGQTAGQRLLGDLAPLLQQVMQRYRHLTPDSAWSCTPGLDIRSMQHERLYSRLCRS